MEWSLNYTGRTDEAPAKSIKYIRENNQKCEWDGAGPDKFCLASGNVSS